MSTKLSNKYYAIVIILILLLVPMLGLYISFLYPGLLKPIDKLRCGFCKTTIEKVDYVETKHFACGLSISKRYTKNAISYTELKPHLNKLNPGTILVTSHGKSVCALIPGIWKHTMIYLGSQQQTKTYFGPYSEFYKYLEPYYKTKNEYLMIDASFRQDVAIRCISNMANLKEQSTLRVLLCIEPKLCKQDNLSYIKNSVKELGKKYDLTFNNSDTEELYCTEIIANSLFPFGIQLQKQSKLLNRDITLPNDFVENIFERKTIDLFKYKYCILKESNNVRNLTISQVTCLPY